MDEARVLLHRHRDQAKGLGLRNTSETPAYDGFRWQAAHQQMDTHGNAAAGVGDVSPGTLGDTGVRVQFNQLVE